jgi:hypothetical protein
MGAVNRVRGQASVETAILLPVVLALGAAAWQGVLIGWTAVEAQDAARQAARAALGREPVVPAARAALPSSMRAGMEVERGGGRVTVHVRVPSVLPGIALVIDASARVVAG